MSDEERWMQTYTGKVFPLETFNPEVAHIEDIAHALGMLCRFNGQCKTFYSVAEHSVYVSHEIAPDLALLGLMHDAAEAYLGEVPTQLKKSLPGFQQTEDKLMKLISEKFRFVFPEKNTVEEVELKRVDMQLLADEKEVVMGREPKPWLGILEVKNPDSIQCWAPDEAKYKFLKRFRELTTCTLNAGREELFENITDQCLLSRELPSIKSEVWQGRICSQEDIFAIFKINKDHINKY